MFFDTFAVFACTKNLHSAILLTLSAADPLEVSQKLDMDILLNKCNMCFQSYLDVSVATIYEEKNDDTIKEVN